MKYPKQRQSPLPARDVIWIVFKYWLLPIFILISLPIYHDNQWFSWVRKPNFEKMFIDCVNESWRSKYIYERSKAAPRMRKEAIEDTERNRRYYRGETETDRIIINQPIKSYNIFFSITEQLKRVSDKSYCKNLIITGNYSYTFNDQDYSSIQVFDIGSFARPPYRSKSLNEYLKKYQFKAMFREFIFGEDKKYWRTVLSKAARNL